jgi:hypothetical protein
MLTRTPGPGGGRRNRGGHPDDATTGVQCRRGGVVTRASLAGRGLIQRSLRLRNAPHRCPLDRDEQIPNVQARSIRWEGGDDLRNVQVRRNVRSQWRRLEGAGSCFPCASARSRRPARDGGRCGAALRRTGASQEHPRAVRKSWHASWDCPQDRWRPSRGGSLAAEWGGRPRRAASWGIERQPRGGSPDMSDSFRESAPGPSAHQPLRN